MPFLSKQQQIERTSLHQAIRTITKVEPLKWTSAIQMRVLEKQNEGLSVSQILQDLDLYLQRYCVRTCTGGNNIDGWNERIAYLTDIQRKKILAWIDIILRTGGRFSDFEEE